jgi:putative addiction module component (TIGR02574 family)
MEFEAIENEALALGPEERARLARKLFLSLETGNPMDYREEWLAEAQKRAMELDRGDVAPVPAEDVFRKARALLR